MKPIELESAQLFTISRFKSKTTTAAAVVTGTWGQILDQTFEIEGPPIRDRKEERELFSPATFKNCQRSKANVIQLSMIVLDFDHDLSIKEAEKVCKSLGVAYGIYTTHSHQRVTEQHQTPEDCFRVIIPLREPIPAEAFPHLWTWANGLFQGKADPACKDASRMFYLPVISAEDAPYTFGLSTAGGFLDWGPIVNAEREKRAEIEKARSVI